MITVEQLTKDIQRENSHVNNQQNIPHRVPHRNAPLPKPTVHSFCSARLAAMWESNSTASLFSVKFILAIRVCKMPPYIPPKIIPLNPDIFMRLSSGDIDPFSL